MEFWEGFIGVFNSIGFGEAIAISLIMLSAYAFLLLLGLIAYKLYLKEERKIK